MNRPLVSFAVVAYNAERCLPELLADLAAQERLLLNGGRRYVH